MSLSSQQYAKLANHSYGSPEPDNRQSGKYEDVEIDGIAYAVLEHVDDRRNGYQGTIYQRKDTGEIVVAHRGTEPKQLLDIVADGGMVLARTNAQADDAIELTRRATRYAEKNEKGYLPPPEVTVTGHSLGGCLAQITAHHHKLRGETFNAYGAVGLDKRIPEGGDLVINHVMAGDPVSAASKHFGQVRVYATAKEIAILTASDYDNNRNPLDIRSPGIAVAVQAKEGSHNMDNFLDVDANGRKDVSVLNSPEARQLAMQFAPMIEKYRNDIAVGRNIVTVGARGPYCAMVDGIDHLRGPLPPGEPAARDARAAEAWAAAVSWKEVNGIANPSHPLTPRAPAKQLYAPESTGPDGPLSLPHYLNPNASPQVPMKPEGTLHGGPQAAIPSHHPDHALYAELKQRLPPETSEDRLAQITLAAKQGGVKAGQVDSLHIAENPLRMFVSGKIPGDRAQVDLTAPPPSVQETLQRSEAYDQQNAQQLAQWQAQDQQLNQSAHSMGARSLS